MPIFIFLIGLFAPRFTIVLLWFFSGWFDGVFATRFWPIIGFLIMPFTLLWYSVVQNWYDGTWGTLQWIVLVIAVLADIGTGKGSRKRRE